MTLALLILLAQDTAEETYRALETKFVGAPGVSYEIKAETSVKKDGKEVRSTVTGYLKVKPGNQCLYEMTIDQGPQGKMTQVSRTDGKTTVITQNGKRGRPGPAQKGATELLRECTLRAGMMPLFVGARISGTGAKTADEIPKPDDAVVLSSFSSPEPDVLEYTVKLFGSFEGNVKLWLKDGLPVKRVFTSKSEKAEVQITETYEKVTLEEIPDAVFAHE